jgi:two-component system CheB/CheR fusion protein
VVEDQGQGPRREEKAGALDAGSILPTCPIVAIGASAGGIDALQALFQALPDDLPAAFVVIVHLDPGRESELAEILSRRTSMPVNQVLENVSLEPGRVYVIPPNRRLLISDREIATAAFDEPRGQRLPIDLFFRSMAEQRGDGVAIVLTGSGADGATGVRAVKEAGGVVLVQEPHEATYSSMPASAIASGVADFVLPVNELVMRLVDLLHSKKQLAAPEAGLDDEQVLGRILGQLRARTGHDFSGYKRTTVIRRLARRMQICRIDRLQEYLKYLHENAEEVQALFADLLISVTAFFRDPGAFDVLAADVIPKLFDAKSEGQNIRVWVPGCATGEEAYSIAMLLLEESARRDHPPAIQVFASDLDAGALATAREGRYPLAIEADVPEARLRKFFLRDTNHYRVKKELRDIVLFATHSLLKDAPFSRLDLVSCRNLLIYLDRDLQRQVWNTLAYALVPGGYLFLGSSEGIEGSVNSIRVIDRQARIFQTTERTRARLPELVKVEPAPAFLKPAARASQDHGRQDEQHAHRQALETLAPPSILVDNNSKILNLSGSAGRYLLHPGGPLSSDVTELARPELRLDLRTGLHRAFEMNQASVSLSIPVQFDGSARKVYLQIRPVPSDGPARRALVLFIEGEEVDEATPGEPAAADQDGRTSGTMRQLREELNSMGVRLRESRQQYGEAIEDLRAANEELQSTNEEYRSTAEELETSKEELQSTNEELQTVNNELKQKLESISRAHSDIENLITSSDVGTLFIDPDLLIKRFTPQVSSVFSLARGDEGRPITDFTHRLDYDDLASDARSVLDRLTPIEHEVRSNNNRWYLMRLRPYRSTEDKIEGIVVTFVDVTERRFAEDALRENQRRLENLITALPAAVYTTDAQGRITFFNPACVDLAGRTPEIGTDAWCIGSRLYHPDATPMAHDTSPMAAALKENREIRGEEILVERPDGTRTPILTFPTPLRDLEGHVIGGVNMLIDVSQQKEAAQHQQLLINELNHRVKNTLAMVQAIASQSFRTASSMAKARQAFDARLKALSQAHDILTAESWTGTTLAKIVSSAIAAYCPDDRCVAGGPDVRLSPKAAVALAMVLHELATNAVKYGALSNDKGRVTIEWTVDRPDEAAPKLNFHWGEEGGPPVETPKRRGFGSRLIERGLAHDLGGKARIEFPASGVMCTIAIPLAFLGSETADPNRGAGAWVIE